MKIIESIGAESEKYFGSPFSEDGKIKFSQVMKYDECDEFPEGFSQIVDEISAVDRKILESSHFIEKIKSIGRRDMTILLAKGKNILGLLPILLFGDEEQKKQAEAVVKNGRYVSFGMTERTNGSDLLQTKVTAVLKNKSYVVNGEKWLINNITQCDLLCCLVKTNTVNGPRAFSSLLLDVTKASSKISKGPKIKLHGVRGLEVGSMTFSDAEFSENVLIGAEGKGFDQCLKSLQISRGLCATLSLGGFESSLRLVSEFVLQRKLYGDSISEKGVVKWRLAEAYAKYKLCEIVSYFFNRSISLFPGQLSVWSAFAKYYVPVVANETVTDLGVTLGSRSYLRETIWSGVFQKIRRDLEVIPLFDGSTQVNLYVLSNQLPAILSSYFAALTEIEFKNLKSAFNFSENLPPFDSSKLQLTNRGDDILIRSLVNIKATSQSLKTREVIGQLELKLNKIVNSLKKNPSFTGFEPERFRLAETYINIQALTCLILNSESENPLSSAVFEVAQSHLLHRLGIEQEMSETYKKVFDELEIKVKADKNLGILDYQVASFYGRCEKMKEL